MKDAGGPRAGRSEWHAGLAGLGLAAGSLNGLLGAGATLLVPALVYLLGERRHHAHATSLPLILAASSVSLVVYVLSAPLPLWTMVAVAAGGVGGSVIGAHLEPRLSGPWLRRLFGASMVAAALRLLAGP